jgi:hypothetical protein
MTKIKTNKETKAYKIKHRIITIVLLVVFGFAMFHSLILK